MNRFELKCYMCNQIIGYMSLPQYIGVTGEYVINSTFDNVNAKKEAVCCPVCERRRIKIGEMTDE